MFYTEQVEAYIFVASLALFLKRTLEYQAQQLAKKSRVCRPIEWELLIRAVLCIGMRRGELLNTTWKDIDFERKTIDVAPKRKTPETWEWHIKDTDRRNLPLTDEMLHLFTQYHAEQPEGYPYVFITTRRYDFIQQLRVKDRWTVKDGVRPINNFDDAFKKILNRAGVENGTFHDLRRTCLMNWFENGLSEYEVMNLAGHACFATTHKFYLAVREDLIERGRAASIKAMVGISVANLLQQPSGCHGLEE